MGSPRKKLCGHQNHPPPPRYAYFRACLKKYGGPPSQIFGAPPPGKIHAGAHDGTDMCIYVLKEVIEFYRCRNTYVFVTFLDASKAYDKIDHWQLFNKLLNIHVPVYIISILVYWYSRQEMYIRWGNSYSTKFRVTNGVKQRGILSPALFNVYMNNLSVSLNHSDIGDSL